MEYRKGKHIVKQTRQKILDITEYKILMYGNCKNFSRNESRVLGNSTPLYSFHMKDQKCSEKVKILQGKIKLQLLRVTYAFV